VLHNGSWSGLGVDILETNKYNLADALFSSPLLMTLDVAMSGSTKTTAPYRLFRLNMETGELE
jgi:hypothetical protein